MIVRARHPLKGLIWAAMIIFVVVLAVIAVDAWNSIDTVQIWLRSDTKQGNGNLYLSFGIRSWLSSGKIYRSVKCGGFEDEPVTLALIQRDLRLSSKHEAGVMLHGIADGSVSYFIQQNSVVTLRRGVPTKVVEFSYDEDDETIEKQCFMIVFQ